VELQKVLEHTCFQAKGNGPLSPEKCRCRKYITVEQARTKVNIGIGRYVVIGYNKVNQTEPCKNCSPETKSSCLNCGKTGLVHKTKLEPINGQDIILTVNSDGLRNLTVKVKKSPTIESKHILRGIENSDFARQARLRWDEYELLTLKFRIRSMLKNIVASIIYDAGWNHWLEDPTRDFPFEIRREPEDNPKTGTGRQYDYGRL